MENKIMENRINVADLLQDCPPGMKLDCTMYEDCEFLEVDKSMNSYIIRVKTPCGIKYLDRYGCYTTNDKAKCVIFPKGKTTWEGFRKPFKNGDIVSTKNGKWLGIVKKAIGDGYETYISIDYKNFIYNDNSVFCFDRFATEEEKAKLFKVIKDNGYEWDATNNSLAKLISNKFSIIDLKPFDKVLVRDHNDCVWRADFYSHYDHNNQFCYVCVGYDYKQCIPYNEETANLIGTTNDCPDKYKIWKIDNELNY